MSTDNLSPVVLFVDDEKNILTAIRRLMIHEEIETLTAGSGSEGLEILRSRQDIGLIVSDQRMPGMSGSEFLEQARLLCPDVPRIMLTGYSDLNATIDAINKGGTTRFLTKPWNDQELVQVIRETLRNYLLVQENQRLNGIIRSQNEELRGWNEKLKARVLEQTQSIREKNEQLRLKHEKLQAMFRSTIEALAGLIELHSKDLRNHSKNVADLAAEIATAQGLPPAQVDVIRVAALLHDIGEIGTDQQLLQKPASQMDQEEILEYMQHTVRGQTALDAVEILRPAGVLIRHHHENYDGSGFPDGLSGQSIPIGSRIIALADLADQQFALEKSGEVEATLKKIALKSGSQVDPTLLPFLDRPFKKLYGRTARSGMVTRKLRPEELREGMVLVDDLVSGTGLLLLKKGATLEKTSIQSVLRYQKLDPFKGEVAVQVKA